MDGFLIFIPETQPLMNWQQVRERYPHKWVLVEMIESHGENNWRYPDQLTVVDAFTEVSDALDHHEKLHRRIPERDYFVVHTDKRKLAIKERYWFGARMAS
uniref:Uncharacterized protein n=2 Tax=unclassified Candidatus Kentrum TaxID=2643149 RepID=A0A451B5E7_9GAMM|nr:MAG: hypothetical protein BECKLPF1236B_GA0070989_12712 [Candidatus Kentron sp. LPFa]VFK68280.1 MAG: hypothetical protein BECKUNK1418G_GA0071005_12215 [Candidatus Kentron sp. UNK]VFK73514.1 MAG: hypothetical protein BECKUNK1418H_GA0071006_12135 [Candidatus Kentron sp. UNK]